MEWLLVVRVLRTMEIRILVLKTMEISTSVL